MTTDELAWFKSSYSTDQGDSCIEVAPTPATIHIRDSKDTTRPHLGLGPAAWAAFVAYAAHAG
ncbi:MULTISPECIES: DUF397 domain-containing protein [Streptomyces]|uniref:DUF397 domain-containing protein n=1 Tax=Streptomyces caniscabiei TaxID=2746961 RepID=A0ABU4MII5_9ACTN|nr:MULTISPECIES: DUF397 domain-containing protein [Streptomyces]MBE4737065.1 DUF397 domain-containing protein [Streptomyces caniscabiei]MBE4757699.1 DUF397 domain-containing protein [Streptomyces caniscabiei]MBE4770909.1 DUF397 domain-containing protein [Streptomyces caniscabiei]MBE4786818.1 DUF397 domain-containing protein [Streptomyces caniscabiei]MBE4794928.1 DUF397 domain-containing protein [Streptomyces caniscabiei]